MMMLPNETGVAGDIVHEDFGDEEEDPDEEAFYPETALELKDRTETQKNLMFSAGGENVLDSWTLDYSLAYSYAEQDTPDDTEFVFINEDLQYTYSGADTHTPRVSVVSGEINGLEGYEFDEVEDADQIVEEKAWLFGANLKKELDTVLPVYLKGGFFVSMKNKTSDIEVYKNEETPEGFESLLGYTSGGRKEYADFPLIDTSLTDYFNSNRDAFEMERDEVDSAAEDYETDEDIYAGYLMGNIDFGTINLLAGARVEYTDIEATGYVIDEGADDPVVGLETQANDYTNFLPGIHVRADLSDSLVLYGAWTNSISRPNWEQTRNARVTDDEEMEMGNPMLDPYEAMNWDATLSYYMQSVGMASVGVFYKDIDNFIYSITGDAEIGGETYELTTWNNGDSGSIYGLELAYQQKLSFLPSPMNGLSIEGNLTLSESEADVPETGDVEARTIDFIGHSDTVGSFALSFEKWNFFARLSGTYRSEYLDGLGEEAFEDEYIDEHFQVDLSTSYTFYDKYTVYANFININNEPLRAYWGESKMLKQYEEYGFSARAGVKFNF
jgi:TonB-dependent receptor